MNVQASTKGWKIDVKDDRKTAYISAYIGRRLGETYTCTKCFPYFYQQDYFPLEENQCL